MTARFFLTTCALALSAVAAQADYTLHILHTNDVHSRIEPINGFDSTCNAEQAAAGECFGGSARLLTAVAARRAALDGQNVILLDAGDQFQGSLIYTTYQGAVEAEMMERIGYDAMAVGNHEFDDGPAGLAALADAVSFPVISGNIDPSREPALAGRIDSHVVLDVGGERIGIIAVLATDTPETSSPGPNRPLGGPGPPAGRVRAPRGGALVTAGTDRRPDAAGAAPPGTRRSGPPPPAARP